MPQGYDAVLTFARAARLQLSDLFAARAAGIPRIYLTLSEHGATECRQRATRPAP